MKKSIYLLLLISSASLSGQTKLDGKELLARMHKKYAGKYCQTITFDQKTTRYDTSGTVKDTSYWYEWISYPDKFRIDFGKKYGGNCVIFKHDSVFNYRNNKLVRKDRDENDLLLLLGGMYYRPLDSVYARLKRLDYDLNSKLFLHCDGTGHMNYVVKGMDGHSFTVDKHDLIVRSINTKISDTDFLSISFDEYKKTCQGYTETKVSGYKNGKLEQKEEYLNLKTIVAIPDSIFNKK